MPNCDQIQNAGLMNRRNFIYQVASGAGSLALTSMLQPQSALAGTLSAKLPHHAPKAKACIFLFMEGGPSHIDTFDPKPKLEDFHLKEFFREGDEFSSLESGRRYYIQSPFKFRRVGKSGVQMCEHFRHLADCADDICFYRGAYGESVNHPTANFHVSTGNKFGGDPALGAWVSYGLGTLNENLPAFVVLPDLAIPQGGPGNWGNGFMPPIYQGTTFRATGAPILDLNPPQGVTPEIQRSNLDLLAELNRQHQVYHPEHEALEARIESYELAFRMQAEIPGVVDLDNESQATRDMYGIGEPDTDNFGRRCLLARRLVERGVRFVQLYSSGWDSHDYIESAHSKRMRTVDKPIAALLKDLKRTGLLDETLVIWTGEFGRTPDNGIREFGKAYGRDHNSGAMPMWFAGPGVRKGEVIGATDEMGGKAVEAAHPIKDIHTTILHLMGLKDADLTYFNEGRFKQISQTGDAKLIREILT